VNADRVKRKIPSLLVDGSTTKKKNWNSLMRYRYRFTQFKKRQPEKFDSIANRIILDLTDLEKAVKESNDTGPCALEVSDGIILNMNILYM
jgi:hypothetical protein